MFILRLSCSAKSSAADGSPVFLDDDDSGGLPLLKRLFVGPTMMIFLLKKMLENKMEN